MAQKDLIRKNVIHVSKKTRRKERKERVTKKSQEREKKEGEINFLSSQLKHGLGCRGGHFIVVRLVLSLFLLRRKRKLIEDLGLQINSWVAFYFMRDLSSFYSHA